jgi:hypothetical protein
MGTFKVYVTKGGIEQKLPVANADVDIAWKSGGGSPLPATHGRTGADGVALMVTPENYLQIGLPTGADGSITVRKGTAVGHGAVGVNFFGEAHDVNISVSSDAVGSVKSAFVEAGSTAKSAAIVLAVILIGAAALIWGIRKR